MQIYERIKYLRKEYLKQTQEEFAKLINMSRSNLGNIEVGNIGLTDRVIKDICKSFGVNEEWLRTGEGEIFTETSENLMDHLAKKHNLEEMDKQIIKIYLSLAPEKRQTLKEFAFFLLNSVLNNDVLYADYQNFNSGNSQGLHSTPLPANVEEQLNGTSKSKDENQDSPDDNIGLVFRAARSENHEPPQYVKRDMSKFKNAHPIVDDKDL